jgi:hypothetical protein
MRKRSYTRERERGKEGKRANGAMLQCLFPAVIVGRDSDGDTDDDADDNDWVMLVGIDQIGGGIGTY